MPINYLGQTVESLRRQFVSGCMHQPDDSPVNKTIINANTWEKIDLSLDLDVATPTSSWEYNVAEHRIYYRGIRTVNVFFNATAVLTNSETPNMTIRFSVHKNGILVGNTISFAKLDNQGSSAHSIDAASGFELSQDDYLEIFTQSDKVSSFDIRNMQLQISENIALI